MPDRQRTVLFAGGSFGALGRRDGEDVHKALKVSAVVVPLLLLAACGFVGTEPISALDPPGFFSGVWNGLLAPWTLILRLFLDIKMYAVPNTGWFYDLGFLIGVVFSIPVGWIAVIIALIVHIF